MIAFQPFHQYNKLVRRGLVKPLACLHCGNEFALVLGDSDEPVLKCFYCITTTTPGLKMYEDIKAVVAEHFI